MSSLARSLGRHLARRPEPPERRTGSRVRRGSFPRGRGRRVVLTWEQKARRLWAFRRWQRRQKRIAGERRRGAGYIAEAVYELMLNRTVRGDGSVEDLSYTAIAGIVGHSKSAVVEAIARLKRFGWIDWVRTFVETGEAGRRGPQVEQGINAYWPCLPIEELRRAGVAPPDAPPPDDDALRRAQEDRDRRAPDPSSPLMQAIAALGELVLARSVSPPIGRSP